MSAKNQRGITRWNPPATDLLPDGLTPNGIRYQVHGPADAEGASLWIATVAPLSQGDGPRQNSNSFVSASPKNTPQLPGPTHLGRVLHVVCVIRAVRVFLRGQEFVWRSPPRPQPHTIAQLDLSVHEDRWSSSGTRVLMLDATCIGGYIPLEHLRTTVTREAWDDALPYNDERPLGVSPAGTNDSPPRITLTPSGVSCDKQIALPWEESPLSEPLPLVLGLPYDLSDDAQAEQLRVEPDWERLESERFAPGRGELVAAFDRLAEATSLESGDLEAPRWLRLHLSRQGGLPRFDWRYRPDDPAPVVTFAPGAWQARFSDQPRGSRLKPRSHATANAGVRLRATAEGFRLTLAATKGNEDGKPDELALGGGDLEFVRGSEDPRNNDLSPATRQCVSIESDRLRIQAFRPGLHNARSAAIRQLSDFAAGESFSASFRLAAAQAAAVLTRWSAVARLGFSVDNDRVSESLSLASCPLQYNPIETADALRRQQGLAAPKVTTGPDDDPLAERDRSQLLWGFLRLEEGWVQAPFLNLTEQHYLDAFPDTQTDQAAPARPRGLVDGAWTLGNDDPNAYDPRGGENPWHVTINDCLELSGQLNFRRTAAGVRLSETEPNFVELRQPELVLNGMVWLANEPPPIHDHLPESSNWLGGLTQISLKSVRPGSLYTAPWTFIAKDLLVQSASRDDRQAEAVLRSYAIDIGPSLDPTLPPRNPPKKDDRQNAPAPPIQSAFATLVYGELHLSRNSPGLFSADVLAPPDASPLAWVRHPALALIQSLPLSQSLDALRLPAESRQLMPFELEVTRLACPAQGAFEGARIAFPQPWRLAQSPGRENAARAWPVFEGASAAASVWAESGYLTYSFLSVPGLSLHFIPGVTVPDLQFRNGQTIQYHHEPPYLAELNALATTEETDKEADTPARFAPARREDYSDHWRQLERRAAFAGVAKDRLLEDDQGGIVVRSVIEPLSWPVEITASHAYPGRLSLVDKSTKQEITLRGVDALRGIHGDFQRIDSQMAMSAQDGDARVIAGCLESIVDVPRRAITDQRGWTRQFAILAPLPERPDEPTALVVKRLALRAETGAPTREYALTSLQGTLRIDTGYAPPADETEDNQPRGWTFWFRDLPVQSDGGSGDRVTGVFERDHIGSGFREDNNDPAATSRALGPLTGYQWRVEETERAEDSPERAPLWIAGILPFFPLTLGQVRFDEGRVKHLRIGGRLQMPIRGRVTEQAELANFVWLRFQRAGDNPDAPLRLVEIDSEDDTPNAEDALLGSHTLPLTEEPAGDSLDSRPTIHLMPPGYCTAVSARHAADLDAGEIDRLEPLLNDLERRIPHFQSEVVEISCKVPNRKWKLTTSEHDLWLQRHELGIIAYRADAAERRFEFNPGSATDAATVRLRNPVLTHHHQRVRWVWGLHAIELEARGPGRVQNVPCEPLPHEPPRHEGASVRLKELTLLVCSESCDAHRVGLNYEFSLGVEEHPHLIAERTLYLCGLPEGLPKPVTGRLEGNDSVPWMLELEGQSNQLLTDGGDLNRGALQFAWRGITPQPHPDDGPATLSDLQVLPGMHLHEPSGDNPGDACRGVVSVAFEATENAGLPPTISIHAAFAEAILPCRWGTRQGGAGTEDAADRERRLFQSSAGDLYAGVTWEKRPRRQESWTTQINLNGWLEVTNLVSWPDVAEAGELSHKLPSDQSDLVHYRHVLGVLLNQQTIPPRLLGRGDNKSLFSLTGGSVWSFHATCQHRLARVEIGNQGGAEHFPAAQPTRVHHWVCAQEVRLATPECFRTFLSRVHDSRTNSPREANRRRPMGDANAGYHAHDLLHALLEDELMQDEQRTLIVEASATLFVRLDGLLASDDGEPDHAAGGFTSLQLFPGFAQYGSLTSESDYYSDWEPPDAGSRLSRIDGVPWRRIDLPVLGRMQERSLDFGVGEESSLRLDPVWAIWRQQNGGPAVEPVVGALASRGRGGEVAFRLTRIDTPRFRSFLRKDLNTLHEAFARLAAWVPALASGDSAIPSILDASAANTAARLSREAMLRRLMDPRRSAVPPSGLTPAGPGEPPPDRTGAVLWGDNQWWTLQSSALFNDQGQRDLYGFASLAVQVGRLMRDFVVNGSGAASRFEYHLAATLLPGANQIAADNPQPSGVAVSPYAAILQKPLTPPSDPVLVILVAELVCLDTRRGVMRVVASHSWRGEQLPSNEADLLEVVHEWARDTHLSLANDSSIALIRMRKVLHGGAGNDVVTTALEFTTLPNLKVAGRLLARRSASLSAPAADTRGVDAQWRTAGLSGVHHHATSIAGPQTGVVQPIYLRDRVTPAGPEESPWPWGLSAMHVDVRVAADRRCSVGPQSASFAGMDLSWIAEHHQTQFEATDGSDETAYQLPDSFRGRVIQGLLSGSSSLCMPSLESIEAAHTTSDTVLTYPALAGDWQPWVTGGYRYLIRGARPGAPLLMGQRSLRQRLRVGDQAAPDDISGTTLSSHRVPRPMHLPSNNPAVGRFAVQTAPTSADLHHTFSVADSWRDELIAAAAPRALDSPAGRRAIRRLARAILTRFAVLGELKAWSEADAPEGRLAFRVTAQRPDEPPIVWRLGVSEADTTSGRRLLVTATDPKGDTTAWTFSWNPASAWDLNSEQGAFAGRLDNESGSQEWSASWRAGGDAMRLALDGQPFDPGLPMWQASALPVWSDLLDHSAAGDASALQRVRRAFLGGTSIGENVTVTALSGGFQWEVTDGVTAWSVLHEGTSEGYAVRELAGDVVLRLPDWQGRLAEAAGGDADALQTLVVELDGLTGLYDEPVRCFAAGSGYRMELTNSAVEYRREGADWLRWYFPTTTSETSHRPRDTAFVRPGSAPPIDISVELLDGEIVLDAARPITLRARFVCGGGSLNTHWGPWDGGLAAGQQVRAVLVPPADRAGSRFELSGTVDADVSATSGTIEFRFSDQLSFEQWATPQPHGSSLQLRMALGPSLQATETYGLGTEGFAETLVLPMRLARSGQPRLPVAPQFLLFEDPEYNRLLATKPGSSEAPLKIRDDDNNLPEDIRKVMLRADRAQYNAGDEVLLAFYVDPLLFKADWTADRMNEAIANPEGLRDPLKRIGYRLQADHTIEVSPIADGFRWKITIRDDETFRRVFRVDKVEQGVAIFDDMSANSGVAFKTKRLRIERIRGQGVASTIYLHDPGDPEDLDDPEQADDPIDWPESTILRLSLIDGTLTLREESRAPKPAVDFQPGDQLLIRLTLDTEESLSLRLNLVAQDVTPNPAAAYAWLRSRDTDSAMIVECARFAWSPAPRRIELVDADDLRQPLVRRRAVFQWQGSSRIAVRHGNDVQKINREGATHIPNLRNHS